MIFSLANSGFIAFSKVMGPGAIENIPLNPALFNSGRFSILPASTITGICSFCASFSILYGTFPIAVCRSAFLSPVIMRSAPFIFSEKSILSIIILFLVLALR